MHRMLSVVGSTAILFFLVGNSPADEAADNRLAEMTERAQATLVEFVEKSKADVKMVEQPLNRFSDQPRGIVDGTFWCWESERRPVAFQKIEIYDHKDPALKWFYCFASASPERIEARWKVGETWTAETPGVEFKTLRKQPTPLKNELRIAFQLKQLSRLFSVRLEDELAESREQLRLIPRPLHEYGDIGEAGIRGAVFRFASNGTNPDALLLLELTDSAAGQRWQYGFIQMTTGKLSARLGDEEVWTAPYRRPDFARPVKFASWMFFHESTAGN